MSPGQASYVLERIIADKRVSRVEASRYLSDMQREIGDLERRLQSLTDAASGGAPAKRRPAPAPPGRKRRKHVTPEQRASRVVQGRYLGLIRQVPATRRGAIKRIAKKDGREAAIKAMASLLGK